MEGMGRLVENYRVELEDFFSLHFINGDGWRIEEDNLTRAIGLYQSILVEFEFSVEQLSDGLVVDLDRLEVLGKQLWFAKQYVYDFMAKVI
jgi:hypothetical protein